MPGPKKIIHLSDLHVGGMGGPADTVNCGEKLKQIIQSIINKFGNRPKDYVVVITGDLTTDATEEDSYYNVREILRKLKDAQFDLLVIPGNHDYGTGARGQKKFVKQFKNAFFHPVDGISVVMEAKADPEDITYPKLDIFPLPGSAEENMYASIAFIGLDSMAEELHWYDQFFADGELGRKQLKMLSNLLAEERVQKCDYRVVYLHHHPFESSLFKFGEDSGKDLGLKPGHSLKDSPELQAILQANKIDALLFGHNHGGHGFLNKPHLAPRIYDGGSTTNNKGGTSPRRVLDLSTSPTSDDENMF